MLCVLIHFHDFKQIKNYHTITVRLTALPPNLKVVRRKNTQQELDSNKKIRENCYYIRNCHNMPVTTAHLRFFAKNHIFPLWRINRTFHTTKVINAKIAYKLSDIGEGIRDVTVKEWFVKVGDRVSQFDNICEVQSDKASVTITSRYDGVITKLYHNVDETALVGQPLVDIDVEDENVESKEEAVDSVEEVEKEEKIDVRDEGKLCVPSVRHFAKENGVDLLEVDGSGKDGRILKEDILKLIQPKIEATEKIEPIRGFRKAMVKTMTDALKVPLFMYADEMKITQITKLRKSVALEAKTNGVKISFLPFFVKAVSNALQRFPVLNSVVDDNCENIIYKSIHNIGIAMDTKAGLAVPVIKNVQNLTIVEIAKELNRFLESGKNGTFAPDDLKEGTFAISNIGSIGGSYAVPIVLTPNVGIVALGKSRLVPTYNEKMEIVPEDLLPVSMSADHRIIDGATAANFLALVKKQIENPTLLFLNL